MFSQRTSPVCLTTKSRLRKRMPSCKPLGIAIVGGLIVSQVLTLYTTPVIYLRFGRLAAKFSRADETIKNGEIISVETG